MNSNELKVLEEVIRITKNEYISLTDIAKYKNKTNPNDVIKNWLTKKTR